MQCRAEKTLTGWETVAVMATLSQNGLDVLRLFLLVFKQSNAHCASPGVSGVLLRFCFAMRDTGYGAISGNYHKLLPGIQYRYVVSVSYTHLTLPTIYSV